METADWRKRIAELEAELGVKDEQIAAKDEQIAAQGARLAELERQVAELAEKVGQNSRNSHMPPSTDSPGERKGRKKSGKWKSGSKRKRGGQLHIEGSAGNCCRLRR